MSSPESAREMRGLKEVVEQGDHGADVGAEVLQGDKHGPSFGRFSLGQRYAEREVGLHVHYLARLGDLPEPAYYCAVYEGAKPALKRLDFSGALDLPEGSLDGGIDQTQTAMLIDDVEPMDKPEGIKFLRSIVRLKPLYECEHFWSDTRKIFRMGGLPRTRIIEDWEAARLRHKFLRVNYGVDGVVEGRAERMDTLSDKTGPFFEGRMLDDLDPPEVTVLPRPRVILFEHSVRVSVEELAVFKAQLSEVFFCPLELHPSATQRISHGGDND